MGGLAGMVPIYCDRRTFDELGHVSVAVVRRSRRPGDWSGNRCPRSAVCRDRGHDVLHGPCAAALHAKYGEHRISVAIEHARILSGDLPRRAGDLVFEWAALHRDELLTNWELARQRKPLRKIDPLE